MKKLKIGAGICLLVQCVLLGFCIWQIVTNQDTIVTYTNIAINVAFGILNIHTVAT